LYGVASRNEARAQAFADKFNGQHIYTSYETMANDPAIDAIYIATPHRFHFEQVMLCLKAGKPVLCEKPLTVNASETQTLIETAHAQNVFLMEAVWTRYLPIYQQVQQWINEDLVGEFRLFISTFGSNFANESSAEDRWLNPELAGGTLLDMGIYPLSVSQWLMSEEPETVTSQTVIGETGVDLFTAVSLQYQNGTISQLSSNFISNNANEFTIYGSKGSITIHAPYWGASKATLTTPNQQLTIDMPHRANGFEYETEEAMRCVRAGLIESPTMSHADTLATMHLMDSIRANIGVKYPFE
jgi:predicted dehydrogenase